ncbi:MAG: hypothetical protein QOK06_1325 [Acidimicrobiaceae bacterium]
MTSSRRRFSTGDEALDAKLTDLLDEAGATANRDLLFEILASAVGIAGDSVDRLDAKITGAALKEMRAAFHAFAPYSHVPKVTIFGSARTLPDDPSYVHARELAHRLASQGWMVVTGAGPGIMAAGLEGAGRDHAFGVSIRLPFESGANAFIAGDDKLISMRYFFTRKLMLMKESKGFVSLPGGFGTLDETFELLTLIQTGKADPAPIVLLDEPGGTFWSGFDRFVRDEVASRRLVDLDDLDLYLLTDDVDAAADDVLMFTRNYHSVRWVGDRLVIRLLHAPTDDELADLNARFGEIATDNRIERTGPRPPEVKDGDHVELARVVLRYNGFAAGKLRRLIDALNRLPSLPT